MRYSIMISAGLDSTTLWYDLIKQGKKPRGIYINAGQASHDNQRYLSRTLSLRLDLALDVVEANRVFEGLTQPPHSRVAEVAETMLGCGDSCASLTIASILAATGGSEVLFTGYTAEDKDRLPKLGRMLELVGEVVAINTGNTAFRVEAPYINTTKADIVQKAQSLEVPLELTWSCLWSGEFQCGECLRCKERRAAFSISRIKDPTQYRKR
jgi:7-cyano-7-deazaguanine synthase